MSATLQVYEKVKILVQKQQKLPTFFIDLKDVKRVLTGIGLISSHACQGSEELFRLWVHEVMRVFADKLHSDQDRCAKF